MKERDGKMEWKKLLRKVKHRFEVNLLWFTFFVQLRQVTKSSMPPLPHHSPRSSINKRWAAAAAAQVAQTEAPQK